MNALVCHARGELGMRIVCWKKEGKNERLISPRLDFIVKASEANLKQRDRTRMVVLFDANKYSRTTRIRPSVISCAYLGRISSHLSSTSSCFAHWSLRIPRYIRHKKRRTMMEAIPPMHSQGFAVCAVCVWRLPAWDWERQEWEEDNQLVMAGGGVPFALKQ